MKPIVIIDFSHTCARMLYTAILQAKPKKQNGMFISSEWIPYFKHLLFNSLQSVKQRFPGEIIIAMDSSNNWRKDFYNEYKSHRAKGREESEINFPEYYAEIQEISEVLRLYFPFKVLKVPKVEADDIAGVLANKFGDTKQVFLVTSDKDWKQVLAENSFVKMWDPIKKDFQTLTDYEQELIEPPTGLMSRYTLHHVLLGDSGDNVPKITDMTEFTDVFKSYLKENEVYASVPKEFVELSIADELFEKFDKYKVIKSGKKKGQFSEDKDIFKSVSLGPVAVNKISESTDTLLEFLNKHPMYMDNFHRNSTLVDFNAIPEELQKSIMEEYNITEINYDPNGILKYFMDEGLGQMVSSITKFYDATLETQKQSSLDDFF